MIDVALQFHMTLDSAARLLDEIRYTHEESKPELASLERSLAYMLETVKAVRQ